MLISTPPTKTQIKVKTFPRFFQGLLFGRHSPSSTQPLFHWHGPPYECDFPTISEFNSACWSRSSLPVTWIAISDSAASTSNFAQQWCPHYLQLLPTAPFLHAGEHRNIPCKFPRTIPRFTPLYDPVQNCQPTPATVIHELLFHSYAHLCLIYIPLSVPWLHCDPLLAFGISSPLFTLPAFPPINPKAQPFNDFSFIRKCINISYRFLPCKTAAVQRLSSTGISSPLFTAICDYSSGLFATNRISMSAISLWHSTSVHFRFNTF